MCLIVLRKPNQELDFEKFKTACLNNPDGYGLSFPAGDGDKLSVLRSATSADPDALYRLIQEELSNESIMLHLRYTTAGETSMRNAHPFPVLNFKEHGEDVRMAHNGTIYKWKTNSLRRTWESDTRAFVRGFVNPLFARMNKGFYSEEVFEDPFVHQLLEDQIPPASVLTFINGVGDFKVVNAKGNGGGWEEGDGVYYSNKYSFNARHRVPVTPYNYNTGYRPSTAVTTTSKPAVVPETDKTHSMADVWAGWGDDDPHVPPLQVGDRVYIPGGAGLQATVTKSAFGWVEVTSDCGEFIDEYLENSLTKVGKVVTLGDKKKPEVDKLLSSLDGLTAEKALALSDAEVDDLVDKYPEDFVTSLLDIIGGLLYDKKKPAKEVVH